MSSMEMKVISNTMLNNGALFLIHFSKELSLTINDPVITFRSPADTHAYLDKNWVAYVLHPKSKVSIGKHLSYILHALISMCTLLPARFSAEVK